MRLTGLVLIAACAVFIPLTTWKSRAQQPKFEVASIKPAGDDQPMMVFGPELRNGTLLGQKVTLRIMLAVAYGIAEPRIIGPGWLDKNRFDMVGESPHGIPDSELRPMLQSLLKDRFKLKSHFEKREMPVYYLTVAKGGVTMAKYGDPDRRPEPDIAKYAGFPMMRGALTLSQLAASMARLVSRPVIDNWSDSALQGFSILRAIVTSHG